MDNFYDFQSELLDEIISSKKTECAEELSHESKKFDYGVRVERYRVTTIEEEKFYGKSRGIYEIFSIPNALEVDKKIGSHIEDIVAHSLSSLLGKINSKSRVLVIGLGNRHISSDSLGSKVCHKIHITLSSGKCPTVMAFCPSVLGLTGIETYDIISGVVEKTNPTHLILIDSLCAGAVSRLGSSIQLSNTGLCPGSGIGNNRKCIDTSICKKIVSIGVPLLIYAGTFIRDTFDKKGIDFLKIRDIMQNSENISNNADFLDFIKAMEKIYSDRVDGIIVSHKDIEEMVKILSNVIANAINKSLGVFELND